MQERGNRRMELWYCSAAYSDARLPYSTLGIFAKQFMNRASPSIKSNMRAMMKYSYKQQIGDFHRDEMAPDEVCMRLHVKSTDKLEI